MDARGLGRAFVAAFNERRLADAEAMLDPDLPLNPHGREFRAAPSFRS